MAATPVDVSRLTPYMVTHPFAELPEDPALLRAVVRDANQNVGLYARPTAAAQVRVGDPV